MKRTFLSLIFVSVACFMAAAQPLPEQEAIGTAKQWMAREKSIGFTENKGQMADTKGKPASYVLFKAESPGLNIWVTTGGLTYQFFKMEEEEENLKWHRVDMLLEGAHITKENIRTEGDITQGQVDYYLGHCPDGIFNVKTFTKITIKDVYPGIDWVLYTAPDGRGLKYDFIVHPNANPNDIKLIYEGSGKFNVSDNQIQFSNKLGHLTEGTLLCYQNSELNPINANYSVQPTDKKACGERSQTIKKGFSYEVTINLDNYNKNQTLTIDPQLVWATFYGGNSDDGPMSVDTDPIGNVFVTGYTGFSTNFPLLDAGTFYQSTISVGDELFILKFSNTGTLLWATYYGGSKLDGGNSIATDNSGNVFITGYTNSTDFPVLNASTFFQGINGGSGLNDVFILKFSNTGVLLWATYYGGSGNDYGYSIAVDGSDNVFVTGYTASANFPLPVVPAPFQGIYSGGDDAFILKFNNNGNRLWATYYGGSGGDYGYSIAVDGNGNVFVTGFTFSTNFPVQSPFQGFNVGGYDAFILKFNNNGNRLWATYYGGIGSDEGYSIAADGSGNVFVTGVTSLSNTFPVLNGGTFFQGTIAGGRDAFILKFNNAGVRLWATYYGGSGSEFFSINSYDNLAIDNCGNVFVSFETTSNPFPYLQNSCNAGYYDNTYNGGTSDVLLSLFTNAGTLLWCTYWGGNGGDFRSPLAVDANNNLFVSGEWTTMGGGSINSATYPVTDPGVGAYYDPTFNSGHDGHIATFIPDPNSFTYTQSQVNSTTCTPCNGSATVNISCGNPPYNYIWSNGASTLNSSIPSNTANALCAGNYTVTVTSNCNQTQTASFTIIGNNCGCTLQPQFTKGTANCTSCGGCKEWIMINTTGGTPPYSYQWPDGYTNRYKNQLCPGNYTINIKDKNGCSVNVNLTTP